MSECGKPVPTLKTFLCAGAPIPGPFAEQTQAALGAKIVSAWGMTGNGAVTLIKLDDDDRLVSTTDGCALPGVEAKVVDGEGDILPSGEIGKLLVRACSNSPGGRCPGSRDERIAAHDFPSAWPRSIRSPANSCSSRQRRAEPAAAARSPCPAAATNVRFPGVSDAANARRRAAFVRPASACAGGSA